MLCEPVMYDADACHVEPRVLLFNQLCDLYRIADVTPGAIV